MKSSLPKQIGNCLSTHSYCYVFTSDSYYNTLRIASLHMCICVVVTLSIMCMPSTHLSLWFAWVQYISFNLVQDTLTTITKSPIATRYISADPNLHAHEAIIAHVMSLCGSTALHRYYMPYVVGGKYRKRSIGDFLY